MRKLRPTVRLAWPNVILLVHGMRMYLVTQSCLTLCNRMDCSLLGSFAHEILQARILLGYFYKYTWILLPGIVPTWGSTPGLLTAGGFFAVWATREAPAHDTAKTKTWLGSEVCLLEELLFHYPGWRKKGRTKSKCIKDSGAVATVDRPSKASKMWILPFRLLFWDESE